MDIHRHLSLIVLRHRMYVGPNLEAGENGRGRRDVGESGCALKGSRRLSVTRVRSDVDYNLLIVVADSLAERTAVQPVGPDFRCVLFERNVRRSRVDEEAGRLLFHNCDLR